MLLVWGTAQEECLPPACRHQEVQQLWQGRPLRQGLPHPREDNDAYHNSGPSLEPEKEGRQHAPGIEQSVRHDWSGGSRLR